ncbi:hypothetical protein RB608_01590 [Nocardioides sp. LHD-245]|uniref:hypothetical protein n=1 Tax=Nocardioides sp. LHD-245 TaxID=3051387 RepID=UPI0027E1F11C|nr:hypothetical protein [Nocardioides sp. LHD-245]
MSPRSLVRRTVAAVAGGAVVAGGLMAVAPVPATHAAPAAPSAEASAAAAWLDGRVAGGLIDGNVSVTMDYALSLDATGLDTPARVGGLVAGVDGGLADYLAGAFDRDASTAKAAYFYAAMEQDPRDAAGLDLVADTEGALDAEGRLGDSGVYGQAWAVLALNAAGSDDAGVATEALIDDQCADGAWGWSCAGGQDIDYTAYSLLALRAAPATPATASAISSAVAFLKSKQGATGGFGDSGDPTDAFYTPDNANTTGLAAWALGASGETERAARASSWIAAHEVVALAGCGRGLDADHGAIAYSAVTLKEAVDAGGVPAEVTEEWTLASAQALAGLAYLPAAQPTVPTTFVDAGTTTSIALAGARAGQQVCVTGLGAPQRLISPASATFAVPAGTADHAVTVTYLGGSTTTTVKALDATKLKVKVPSTIKAKKKATIKVKGLAAGEPVTVKVGKKTATGTANAKGVAKVKVKVKKKGKAKVKVVGAFPDRKGKATTRVR